MAETSGEEILRDSLRSPGQVYAVGAVGEEASKSERGKSRCNNTGMYKYSNKVLIQQEDL